MRIIYSDLLRVARVRFLLREHGIDCSYSVVPADEPDWPSVAVVEVPDDDAQRAAELLTGYDLMGTVAS